MESDDENNQVSVKKRRLQNACDECRKRKIKCDSANMPQNICSNCKAFNVECTHLHANAKKKRGPPKGTPRGKRTIQSIVSSILSPTKPYEIPEDQSAVREVLVDLANHIRSLEEQLAEARKEPTTAMKASTQNSENSSRDLNRLPSFGEPRSSVAMDSSIEDLSYELKYLELDSQSLRHFGQSSSIVLIKNALDIKQEYTGDAVPPNQTFNIGTKRLEFWTIYPWQLPPKEKEPPLDFPKDDLMKDLIDLYFSHMNQFVLILHRPTFERSVAEGLHHENRQFGSVVLAVCALGARHSNDPGVFMEGSTSGYSIGWQWIRQVKLFKSSFVEPPTLFDVQLYGLYVLFMQETSTPEACWIIISLGVRLAQDVGAHRRRTDKQITVEGELWKRAFWMLYAMDAFASAFMGRPRAVSSEDFDIDLPIECDDEYWEHPDPNLAFKQPPGKPSTVSAWILLLRLIEILALSQRTIYAVRRAANLVDSNMSAAEWNQRAVAELDSRLNEWIESLPAHLKWDPNREDMNHFHQSVLLYVVYYWVQIQVHRPFVSPAAKGSTTTFPSLAICANAARSCCHVMEVQQARGPPLFSNITLMALFNAAIFLTLNVWRGGRGRSWADLNNAFSDVYKCMKMIRTYESRWQEAGRLNDIVGDLVSVTHLRSSAKRQRETDSSGATPRTQPHPPPPRPIEIVERTESVFISKEPIRRKIAGSTRVSQSHSQTQTPSESNTLLSTRSSPVSVSPVSSVSGTTPAPILGSGSGSGSGSGLSATAERPFVLPVNSSELGSLPVYSSFNWSSGASVPQVVPGAYMGMSVFGGESESQYGTGLGEAGSLVGQSSTNVEEFSSDAAAYVGGGHGFDSGSGAFLTGGNIAGTTHVGAGAARDVGLGFGLGGLEDGVVQDSISSYTQRLLAEGLSAALGTGGHGHVHEHGFMESYLHEQSTTDDLAMNVGNENSELDDWGSYMADVDELLRAIHSGA